MLRNHGLLTTGKSVADAFLAMYIFESACKIQVDAQAGGELVMIHPQILQGLAAVMKQATAGMGAELVWPALIRKLNRTDTSYQL
jgi:ribulose-5-phosphate 4-epimerase/fuculose-1-phosphate aldolase